MLLLLFEMVVFLYRVVCNICKEIDLKVLILIIYKEMVSVNFIFEVWVFFILYIFVNLYKYINIKYMMYLYMIIKNVY